MRGTAYGIDGPNALFPLGGATLLAGAVTAGFARTGRRRGALVAGLAAAAVGTPAAAMLAYSTLGKSGLRDLLLDEVAWRGDATVLDVGTGAGLMAVGAAARTRGPVLGVDIWTSRDLTGNGPGRALRNADDEGVRVRLARGDAMRLPVRDASIDVVLSVLCLHNLPRPEEACAEIVRVLAPGGTVVVADFEGTAAYAQVFAASGLTTSRKRAPLRRTFGPMGIVVARA